MLGNVLKSIWSQKKNGGSSLHPSEAKDKVVVFTTMHAAGFNKYGIRFLESFLKFWPENYELHVYAEDFDIARTSDRVKVLDLHESIPELQAFKRRHALNPVAAGQQKKGYNYRFDAVRFANKSFVMWHAYKNRTSKFSLWLDADTVAFLPVPRDFLQRILVDGEFMAYLGRIGVHSETGFLPFDFGHASAQEFFEALKDMYVSDTVFSLQEWHDCQVIDAIRVVMQAQGKIATKNLNIFGAAHPFVNSVAGLFLDHMKGPQRKDAGKSSGSDYLVPPYSRVNFYAGRYSQLPGLIEAIKPKSIVEVGTWSGWRAVQMCLISLQYQPEVHYKGFDVFDVFTKEFDAYEMNVKPHFSREEVDRLLSLLAQLYPEFTYELVQGNTNDTLKDEVVDFVFLDGGHSVETIKNDFEGVKRSHRVLLDDYYTGPIDIEQFGCNVIVEGAAAGRYQLLPVKDPVAGGGSTQFVLI
jgi:hypothetical protein